MSKKEKRKKKKKESHSLSWVGSDPQCKDGGAEKKTRKEWYNLKVLVVNLGVELCVISFILVFLVVIVVSPSSFLSNPHSCLLFFQIRFIFLECSLEAELSSYVEPKTCSCKIQVIHMSGISELLSHHCNQVFTLAIFLCIDNVPNMASLTNRDSHSH